MGRNNDTFTLIIDRNRETWSKFRRALRKEDQELFDEMWRAPKLHLAAGAFIANEIPLETIFMSMLLEQYRKIKYLETAQYVRVIGAGEKRRRGDGTETGNGAAREDRDDIHGNTDDDTHDNTHDNN